MVFPPPRWRPPIPFHPPLHDGKLLAVGCAGRYGLSNRFENNFGSEFEGQVGEMEVREDRRCKVGHLAKPLTVMGIWTATSGRLLVLDGTSWQVANRKRHHGMFAGNLGVDGERRGFVSKGNVHDWMPRGNDRPWGHNRGNRHFVHYSDWRCGDPEEVGF